MSRRNVIITVFLALAAGGLVLLNNTNLTNIMPPTVLTNGVMDMDVPEEPDPSPVPEDPPQYFKVSQYNFPSVKERLQYYMGDWYGESGWTVPDSDCMFLSKPADYLLAYEEDIMMSTTEIKNCIHRHKTHAKMYCSELHVMINKANITADHHWVVSTGDRSQGFRETLPIITKARPSTLSSKNLPIIWPLTMSSRHFGPVEQYDRDIIKEGKEIPWAEKLPKLFWRGVTTGQRVQSLVQWINYNDNHTDIAFNGIVQMPPGFKQNYVKRQYVRDNQSLLQMNRYKYLLSVQGNDVATGLKWMLYSNSVVFMPRPTRVSWAMEDLLVPFVHYIPLADDLSNLLEMVKWANEHDEACQEISKRATEFIKHLWMSDQAKKDNEYLEKELVTTYVKQFDKALSKCAPGKI